jgi:hypothetical protein
MWSLPVTAVVLFLHEALDAVDALLRLGASRAWYDLADLLLDVSFNGLGAWTRVAREAANRARQYGSVDAAHHQALAAWYRAIAFVFLAGARTVRRQARS